MIKVFTTGEGPYSAGGCLTKQFESWEAGFDNGIEIISIESSSNKYGWMLVIHYKII